MNTLRRKSWSPWVVGAGIGVLSWFSFASVDKPIGITTAFEYTAALATRSAAPTAAASNPYFTTPDKDPKIDWEWMLVVGVFVGAFASSKLSGDRPAAVVPRLWAERFGSRAGRRFIGALLGGALLMIGARLAGGCTSGHGIFGLANFERPSLVTTLSFMVGGVLTTNLIYRVLL